MQKKINIQICLSFYRRRIDSKEIKNKKIQTSKSRVSKHFPSFYNLRTTFFNQGDCAIQRDLTFPRSQYKMQQSMLGSCTLARREVFRNSYICYLPACTSNMSELLTGTRCTLREQISLLCGLLFLEGSVNCGGCWITSLVCYHFSNVVIRTLSFHGDKIYP